MRFGVEQDIDDTMTEIPAHPWEAINRERRLQELYETDWTQVPDSPLTDSKKTEWRTYRQVLRDLPTHSNWPELADSDWPTPPT